MRFHVVSLPHTQTTRAFNMCAYTQKVRKFCAMMRNLGHTVFLYAGDQNEAECDELITCITENERLAALDSMPYIYGSFNGGMPHWQKFNEAAIAGIKARHQSRDFICVIAGTAQQAIGLAFPHPNYMVVEFGVGYGGTFALYRVFESYAWMHMVYGSQAPMGNPHQSDGQWFDDVIPNYFDVSEFPLAETKEDYYLFIGRLTHRKGYTVASEVCKTLGARLLVAGQGQPPDYGEYIGVLNEEQRGQVMSRAKAVFVPTLYVEPFGAVVIEAMLCGTPVICTDWGAFTETVVHGVNGYRCRMFADFLLAAVAAPKLSSRFIREHAISRYSLEVVGQKYQTYFERLLTLWGEGWYTGKDAIASLTPKKPKLIEGKVHDLQISHLAHASNDLNSQCSQSSEK